MGYAASRGRVCQARNSSRTPSVAREISSGAQVLLDVARRHAARIEGDHLLVEALEASLVLLDELRLEGAFAVARNLDFDRSAFGLNNLAPVPIARVARSFTALTLVPQVLGHFRLQQALHDRAFQLGENALGTKKVLFRRAAFKQRIDEFLLGRSSIAI